MPPRRELGMYSKQSNERKGCTFKVNISTHDCLNPRLIDESFVLSNITPIGGFNLLTDLMDNLKINQALEGLSIKKSPWATYSAGLESQLLITAHALGFQRIEHMALLRNDPLVLNKFNLKSAPHKSNLYRLLERFDSQVKVDELSAVNSLALSKLCSKTTPLTLDLDSTVNTVHGMQEGSSVGYNPRYRGRRSYQPLIAFDAKSNAVLNGKLRNGMTCGSEEIVDFYFQTKRRLPQGVKIDHVRGDKGFSGHKFLEQLEKDKVHYAIKLKMTAGVKKQMSYGVLWKRIYGDHYQAIEVGSISLRLSSWDNRRRVILIRTTEYSDCGQLRLFDLWDYQAIVTNLDWSPVDIWQFYNQRATCENTIKELKYGLSINSVSKNNFLANYAHLWFKIIGHNILQVLKLHGPEESRNWSIPKLQRLLLNIPAILIKHARQLSLRLPSWWPYQDVWRSMRQSIPVRG